MTTDTSEQGLEELICKVLTGKACVPSAAGEISVPAANYFGVGWSCNSYRDYGVDRSQLAAFLSTTQPELSEAFALDEDGPTRRKFLARLQGEFSKWGIVDVLRKGIRHGPHELALFYGTPSPRNVEARERFKQNRFTVTRQLRDSHAEA